MSEILLDKESHSYEVGGIRRPSVTHILKSEGIIDTAFYTEKGRQIGEAVHLACEYLDKGIQFKRDALHKDVEMRLLAYEKFKSDTHFSPMLIEEKVYHPTLNYCGTLDRTGILGENECLIDLKCGVLPKWISLQLWAYELCLPNPTPKKQFGLQLKKDGSYSLKQFGDASDRDIWVSIVNCYNYKEGLK